MTGTRRPNLHLHLVESGYALLVLLWFVVPLFASVSATLVPPLLPVSFLDSARGAIIPFLLVACVVSPIPLLAVFKLVAPFLASRIPSIADPKRIVAIVLDTLLSGLVLATLAIHLLKEASGPGYFRLQPVLSWAVFAASMAVNVLSVAFLIAALEQRDDVYQEYLEFRREGRERDGNLLAAIRRPGIQKRLTLTFLPFILAVIVIPAVVILGDFRRATLATAIAGGKTLAEQAALAVGGSSRDANAVAEYFSLQARNNAGTPVPFQAMMFAKRNERTGAYEFSAGTDRRGSGRGRTVRGSRSIGRAGGSPAEGTSTSSRRR